MRLFLAFFAVTFVPGLLQWYGVIDFWASWGMSSGFILLILWLHRPASLPQIEDDGEDDAVCMDHD